MPPTPSPKGEVLQLLNCHNATVTEEDYLQVIHYKTAKLFEAAGQIGAIISQSTPEVEASLARYGMHLGTAFQLDRRRAGLLGRPRADREAPG